MYSKQIQYTGYQPVIKMKNNNYLQTIYKLYTKKEYSNGKI